MTRTLVASAVLLCTAVTASPVSAASQTHGSSSASPIRLLSDAAAAVRKVTYRGTIVYLRSGDVDTVQVVHRLHDGTEQERLVSQSGEAREVIRKGDEVTSILPERKLVLISEHAPKTLLGSVAHFSPDQLKTYYNVAVEGPSRFAGRTCRIVSIEPTDDYRYGYRMWVDKQTDLPLKLSLRYNGDRLEQLMFTDIAFPETVPDDAFISSYDVRGFKVVRHQSVHLADDTADDNSPNWHIRNLPPGFRLAENGVRQVTPDASVRQMLFTDGVATVSAFIAPAGLRAPLNGATRMGAVNAYGNIVGNSQITVVGEVPAVTAKRIAENLVRAKNAISSGEREAATPDG
ncbi:MAG: hypothetical protein CMP08_08190 [Xanthomonadales bacterium]|nr:hypothetical protein [Xanthomonadales bacterium]